MSTSVNFGKLHTYNITVRATTKKGIQKETLKSTINTSKWNSKNCQRDLQAGREKGNRGRKNRKQN